MLFFNISSHIFIFKYFLFFLIVFLTISSIYHLFTTEGLYRLSNIASSRLAIGKTFFHIYILLVNLLNIWNKLLLSDSYILNNACLSNIIVSVDCLSSFTIKSSSGISKLVRFSSKAFTHHIYRFQFKNSLQCFLTIFR